MSQEDDPGPDETSQNTSESDAMPKVDFSTFVLSLGTTALYQLGAVPSPETGELGLADPLVAQQTIDTLEMLREKTVGNLNKEETQLIDSLLYELRIKFLEQSR